MDLRFDDLLIFNDAVKTIYTRKFGLNTDIGEKNKQFKAKKSFLQVKFDELKTI